VPRLKKE